jgi:hypothetical protein
MRLAVIADVHADIHALRDALPEAPPPAPDGPLPDLVRSCVPANYWFGRQETRTDVEAIINDVFEDLRLVAWADPNERLPKEDQIRSRIFASIRAEFKVVCAEKGYTSIENGGRKECDLWAVSKKGQVTWIEFKRCWYAKGWNNKPSEQYGTWLDDLRRLGKAKIDSHRYFFLFGFFDFDPRKPSRGGNRLMMRVRSVDAEGLVHNKVEPFQWRNGKLVAHMAAWAWHWRPGIQVRVLPNKALVSPTRHTSRE